MAKTPRTVLATAQVLTGSFAVVGTAYDTTYLSEVTFELVWGKASATGLELAVEGRLSSAGQWIPAEPTYDAGAAIVDDVAEVATGFLLHQYTVEGALPALVVPVGGFRELRIRARETGTPGGTLDAAAGGVTG